MANNPHEHHPFMPWSPWAPADMGVPPYGVPMFVPPIPIWEQPPPPMNMWYSQYFANSPVFRDREPALAVVREIKKSAKRSLGEGEYLSALWKYQHAINICSNHELVEEEAIIHANCAFVGLKMEEEDHPSMMPYNHAARCIALKPDFEKAYYRRAEAAKRLILSDQISLIPSEDPYLAALMDYCHCFTRNPETIEALAEAVILAVDFGLTRQLLSLTEKHIADGVLAQLYDYLIEKMPTSKVKVEHLEFIFFKLQPVDTPFDASAVDFTKLVERDAVNDEFLSKMLKLGMKIKEKDIKDVIHILPDGKAFKVLDFAISNCPPPSLSAALLLASKAAIKSDKQQFLAYLIEHGATPAVADVIGIVNWSKPHQGLLKYVVTHGTQEDISPLVYNALSQKQYKIVHSFLKLGGSNVAKHVSIAAMELPDMMNNMSFLEELAKQGVNLGRMEAVAKVLKKEPASIKHVDLLCFLLKHGAKSSSLRQCRFQAFTPLHVATELALESGNTDIFQATVQSVGFELPNDGKVVDETGKCPYHLIAKSEYSMEVKVKVCNALSSLLPRLDPTIQDKGPKRKKGHGKSAKEYVTQGSEIYKCLVKAEATFIEDHSSQTENSLIKANTHGATLAGINESIEIKTAEELVSNSIGNETSDKSISGIEAGDGSSISESVTVMAEDKPAAESYGTQQLLSFNQKVESVHGKEEILHVPTAPLDIQLSRLLQLDETYFSYSEVALGEGDADSTVTSVTDELSAKETLHDCQKLNFDTFTWEVEFTPSLRSFFKKARHEQPKLLASVISRMGNIAQCNSSWNSLSKPILSGDIELFVMELEGCRILWEKAIQYSAFVTKKANTQEYFYYVQVLRLWDVDMTQGEAADMYISDCIKRITNSYKRGRHAAIPLTPINDKLSSEPNTPGCYSVMHEVLNDLPNAESMATSNLFLPAASMRESEYCAVPFYSLSDVFVKALCAGSNSRYDFPHKPWPTEDYIINLEPTKAVLLLGRSGTGKTTCCLHRLWVHFRDYWNKGREDPGIVRNFRTPLSVFSLSEVSEELNGSDETNGVDESLSDTESLDMAANNDVHAVGEVGDIEAPECQFEHLKQVFVTKNPVLCSQLKRKFYDFAAAHSFLHRHMEFEKMRLPNTLPEVPDHQYPLFVTSQQFLLLLDRTLPEESFFGTKDPNKFKILSAEYDFDEHEMMMELHDSGDEEEEENGVHLPQQGRVVWTEITATYFVKTIWPKISRSCPLKNLDPALVWTEIKSFIKGSMEALQRCRPLDIEEYEKVGKKLAPNYAEERKCIYDLFIAYNQFRQNCAARLFDECDLIHNLYRRLVTTKDFRCPPHRFYIDEVQDFTQAELLLILACCQDPNGLFFTGDTAQSIMQGVSFRFKDLRSMFQLIGKNLPELQLPTIYKLVTNFRSHAGILRLAGTVIDLLLCFFKQSFDSYLPRDRGILEGPHPVLLWSPDINDLAFLLKIQKRDSSVIEFGAHQVVIVRSKEVRQELPKIFESAIVLTVFEAKGLEFDDVLLYNFFNDSLVDSKGWRVISNYLNDNTDQVITSLPSGFTVKNSRATPFDPRQHKALNSELKCLYTAVTRAKSNLWIYDSDEEKRHPMFEYWFKRGVVRETGTDKNAQADLIFASVSTKEQWKAQGDYFKRKHLYDQAIQCYTKSGEEFLYLQKEVQACKFIQEADTEKSSYVKAAILFLEADELHHDLRYLSNATVCLMKAQPPKYLEAARLYEKLGKTDLAFNAFKKGRSFSDCVRIKESLGLYTEAVEVLDKAKMRIDAVQHSALYEKNGHILSADMNTNTLAHKYARLYAKQKDQTKLEAVIEYIPDPARRVRYWKDCGRYEKALDIYMEEKLYDNAYRLISGQGWYDKGLSYAEKIGKTDWRVNFTIQKAQSQLSTGPGALDSDTVSSLQGLLQLNYIMGQRPQTVAIIQLLLGRATNNSDSICRAIEGFKASNQKVGELEAYGQLFHVLKREFVKKPADVRFILSMCQAALGYANVLSNCAEKNVLMEHKLQQSLDLNGLKVAGDVYCMPPSQNIWVPALKQCEMKDEPRDLDGMVRLDISKTQEVLANHFVALSEQFCVETEIEKNLQESLAQEFIVRFCKQLGTGLLRTPSFIVDANGLTNYISMHISWIEYCSLTSHLAEPKSTDGPIGQLLTLYQPKASIFLPLSKNHLKVIRSSGTACSAINGWIKRVLEKVAQEEVCSTDVWLVLWRASCISSTGGGGNETADLMSTVKTLANNINQHMPRRAQSYTPPAPYIFYSHQYYHHFFFWLRACDLIRKNKDVTTAAQCIVTRFLPHIAQTAKMGSSISLMNVVELLSIHSTALLTILACTLYKRRLSMSFKVRVPHMYQHVIQIFDDLNTQSKGDRWLLKACIDQVDEAWRNRRISAVSSSALQLLCDCLELLLGYHEALPVLQFALTDPNLIASGASCHCLILTLTLVANLAVVCRSNARTYLHKDAKSIEERCVQVVKVLNDILSAVSTDDCPSYIRETSNIMCSKEWSAEVFGLIQYLIQLCYPGWGVAELYRHSYRSDIIFNPIKCRSRLLSTSAPSDLDVSSSAEESSGYETISSLQEETTEEYSEQPEEEVALEGEAETDELNLADMSLTEEQPQDALEDVYVMNGNYCTLCEVELDSQQAEEGDDDGKVEQEEKEGAEFKNGSDSKDGPESMNGVESHNGLELKIKLETYEDHIKSKKHIDRQNIYKKYTAMVEEYSIKLKEMLKVLEELTHASKVYFDEDSPFAELIDKMETENEYNRTECENINEYKNWQEGITKLECMIERVHNLAQLGRNEADKVLKRLPPNAIRRNFRINVEEELEDADIKLDIVE